MSTRGPGRPIGDANWTFVERFAGARVRAGLSIENVAKRTEELGYPIPVDTIGKIAAGKQRVSLDDGLALAKAVDRSLSELIGEL